MLVRRLLAAVSAATLTATLLAAPASAETLVMRDPAGDSQARGMDIVAVRVVNTDARLRVLTRHVDLRRSSGGSLFVWLDTDRGRRGPDFFLTGGAGAATDWQIFRARGFRLVGDPLPCFIRMDHNYDRDTLRFRTGRDCLGRYGRVRVNAVAVRTDRDTGDPFYDYVPARRELGPWVRRG